MPVPAPLLGSLLAQIDDLAELKCTLRAIDLLNRKRSFPRFVSLRELQGDESLVRGIETGGDASPLELIEQGLGRAVRRGTLAFAVVGSGDRRQPIFGLNTESDRAALAAVSGTAFEEIHDVEPSEHPHDRPNIFGMYEQNIGLLNPMVADELREAEGSYPPEWIEDAFREAVANNRRSWRYISRILERWERDGRGYGEPGRYSEPVVPY